MKKIAPLHNFPYTHLLFGGAICLAVYHIILGKVGTDEVEAFHTAWKMFTGEVIYRDFFQHHHPLFYYLLIPVIAIGGETVLTFHLAELFSAALWAGIVVTTYRLSKKIYGDRRIALLSIVLLLTFPWFVRWGTHIRPDTLQVLLGLLSFWSLVLWLDGGSEGWPESGPKKKKKRHLLLSALLLSLSFLTLQKAVFLMFPVGLILLHRLFSTSSDARITMTDFLLYWALFSLMPMLYVIYLLMVDDFRNYFDFNWLINMELIQSFSVFDVVSRNVYAPLSITGFTALFIMGCFIRPPRNASAHWATVLAGICLIASLFVTKIPHPQYFLMAMPFVSIVAAASLQHFLPRAMTGLILSMLLLLGSVPLIESTKDGRGKRGELSAMRHVLEVSGPEDIYFGYRMWNLFRRNTDFFWFCFTPTKCLETYQGFREYDWDPVRIIKQTHPKVISVQPGAEGWYTPIIEHPAIASRYERSSRYGWLYTRKDALSE